MSNPQPPEPFKARMLRLLWKLTGRKGRIDTLLTSQLKYRHYLPEASARDLIPRFDDTEIHIRQCPIGAWSTPLVDVFVLLKAAQGFAPRRILELGSYRGHTALLLAENTPAETTICTVDVDERHGAAYRGLPAERRITRKVGEISPALFQPGEKYDFIFVDANHDYHSALNDSRVALSLLSGEGVIFWHDYRHDVYFHGMAGVPEALQIISEERPLAAIKGTMLAMYSSINGWETGRGNAVTAKIAATTDVWEEIEIRG